MQVSVLQSYKGQRLCIVSVRLVYSGPASFQLEVITSWNIRVEKGLSLTPFT